jgi:tRNA A37 threonylcarbamoyladenosine synthetase subunit TsaC/SUA5/YrdC
MMSTTAAPHGHEPYIDPHEIDDVFPGLAMVLDGGVGGSVPTTVVDLTNGYPQVVREGAGAIDDFPAAI